MNTGKYSKLINVIIILLIELFTFRLFYYQAYATGESFYSDLPAHISTSLNNEGYSLVVSLIQAGYRLVNSFAGIALVLSLTVVLTVLALNYVITKRLNNLIFNNSCINYFPLAASFIFIAAYYLPITFGGVYRGQLITQPWHNSTYLVMRLFAVFTIYLYFDIERSYLDHISLKKALLFTVSLALSTYAKPNFLIGFAPMMLLFLIYDFIKTKTGSFKQAVLFGVCVFPSLAVLYYQSTLLYPAGGDSNVIFTYKNIYNLLFTGKLIVLLITNFAFCIYALYFFIKTKTLSRRTVQCWAMLLIGWGESIILAETGRREGHGNFGWGLPLFSLFLISNSFIELMLLWKRKMIKPVAFFIGVSLYIMNVIIGIGYFIYLQFGYNYYI